MPRLLVLIDLQKNYIREEPKEMKYILQTIDKFKAPIICLTCEDLSGLSILPSIRRVLKNKRTIYIDKIGNDGSKEVMEAIKLLGMNPQEIVADVMGCFTECCVTETVAGLAGSNRIKKIRIHSNGVISDDRDEGSLAIKEMKRWPRVRILR